jgi:hypothetical protein
MLSTFSPSTQRHQRGSLAGSLHRAAAQAQAIAVVEGGWYAMPSLLVQGQALERMLVHRQGRSNPTQQGWWHEQAWLRRRKFKPVVLCRRLPNNVLKGTRRGASSCFAGIPAARPLARALGNPGNVRGSAVVV